MIKKLCSVFAKDCENFSDPVTVKYCGIVCSSIGIVMNLLLFFVKIFAGSISGSAAVTVDAVHNLTDMGSSAVTLISFLLPVKGKRIKENIAGLVIGVVLFITGTELGLLSAEKIASPEPVEFSVLTVVLLIISVFIKFYMSFFYSKYSLKTGSPALRAASVDCLCDSLATSVAVFSVVAAAFTDANVDAWGGLTVSLFILYAGGKTAVTSVLQLFKAIK